MSELLNSIRSRIESLGIGFQFVKTVKTGTNGAERETLERINIVKHNSGFVERFPELSLFYRLFSPLDSEMICIFPYFCPYAESAREIREIFVALHINNWSSEPILI